MKISKRWLNEKSACSGGKEWFENQTEKDGVAVVEKLMAEQKFEWANWLIARLMKQEQYVKYAVFAAEQVAYLWKDKYPEKYKIWKEWVDVDYPAAHAARAAADAAADAAYAAARAAARAA